MTYETDRGGRHRVSSFDIFDTLLARRCVHPFNIFHFVEQRSKHAGFTQMRVLAERQIAGGDYDLPAIYTAMMSHFGLGRDEAVALMRLELQEEYSNLIPIYENCRLVQPGDLLISDMYLPMDFVRRVIDEKTGLRLNPIYLSTHGKSRGTAWSALSEKFDIAVHTGDNLHSDIAMPKQFGIETRLTEAGKSSPAEQYLAGAGFEPLAWAIREARLALDIEDGVLRSVALAQIQWNFPLIYLASLALLRCAKEQGWKTLLFSSRDCYLWRGLFTRLCADVEADLACHYFLTSRVARSYPSEPYLDYFRSLCAKGPAAVVDLCGTGWSLTRLFEAAGAGATKIFFIQKIVDNNMMKLYRQLGEIRSQPQVLSLITGNNNSALEAFNTAPHPMLLDVAQVGGQHYPVFSPSGAGEAHQMMGASQEGFELALEKAARLGRPFIEQMSALVNAEQLQYFALRLNENIGLLRPFWAAQIAEDKAVIETIAQRASSAGQLAAIA